MKRVSCFITILLYIMATTAFGHPGGTDSNGGHHDYNNVSGLGDYHYHHGMGPHLHDNGVCPYDTTTTESAYENSSVDYSDELYTFTEDELFYYVLDEVEGYPESYGVVSIEKYEELKSDYEFLKKTTLDKEKATTNTLIGVGIAAALAILLVYIVYKKYSGEYKRGYIKGFEDGCGKKLPK